MAQVEMMRKAIKDSRLDGWKWTANKNGLKWEYLDIEFTLIVGDLEGHERAELIDEQTGCRIIVFVIDNPNDEFLVDDYHDFEKNIDDAIYWATRKIITKANRLY